jgi:site-specific DNA-cytosine methylase
VIETNLGWTEYGLLDNGNITKISDSQRYKVLGNAVTTNVITEIIKQFITNLSIKRLSNIPNKLL